MRRGFTLLELTAVLAVIATLAAISAPKLETMLLRSRAAEARTMLEGIAHAERAYFRDHGRYLACQPSGEAPPNGTVGRFNAAKEGWHELGFFADGGVRFTYEVQSDGKSFTAIAHGDLDADGQPSTFKLDGATLVVSVDDELE